VGEISAASSDQRAGVSQIGEAVTAIDQMTQQNAALVEQMAAAASGLKSQASALVRVVSVFQISDEPLSNRELLALKP
jgi:methyl-accepting chemotaxis protein